MFQLTHLSRVYARGAFSVAYRQKEEESWLAFIVSLGDILNTILPLLSHPHLRDEDKYTILSQTLGGSVEQNNFLKVLVFHRRLDQIQLIGCAFQELLWAAQSICVMEVQTPYPLNENQKELIINSLSRSSDCKEQLCGKTVHINETENVGLLAGVVCIIGDMVIDLSIQGRYKHAVSVLSRSSV